MRKASVLSISLLIYSLVYSGEVKKNTIVLFPTNDYELSIDHKNKLKKFIGKLDLDNDYVVVISGHTDNRGSHSYNDDLSFNRANSVKTFLIKQGIGPESLVFDFFGERKPIEDNADREKMKKNRRVEVSYKSYHFENEMEVCDSLASFYTNKFKINPNENNNLIGKNGIQLNIRANSFIYEDGKIVEEEIQVEMLEANDFLSSVAHNLNIVSGNELIESGGMLKIEAFTKTGRNVSINKISPIVVTIPTDINKNGMEIFVSNDGQNWETTGESVTNIEEVITEKFRPEIQRFRYTNYIIDNSTKPIRPQKPRSPRLPYEPRISSYSPHFTIWNLFFKERAKMRANQRYLLAMDEYMDKMTRYELNISRYLLYKEKYIDKVEKYKKGFNAWQENNLVLANEDYNWQVKQWEASYGAIEAKYVREMKEQRELRTLKVAQDMDKLQNADLNMANSYTMNILSMGWINCDRFLDETVEERVLAVWDNDETRENVYLIFPDLYGKINMFKNDDAYRSSLRVPQKERMIVFALKVQNGRPYIYYQEVDSDVKNLEMVFKQSRFSDLKGILEDIKSNKTASL